MPISPGVYRSVRIHAYRATYQIAQQLQLIAEQGSQDSAPFQARLLSDPTVVGSGVSRIYSVRADD
jgi:hypothetical protein